MLGQGIVGAANWSEVTQKLLARGADISLATNLFLKQAVREQALPIRPALTYAPNAQTARALTHAQRVTTGKDPEDGAVFEDANQAADFLDSLA